MIGHFYPQRALCSPLDDPSIVWPWDPSHQCLRATVEALRSLDPSLRPGTRGQLEVSEELVLGDGVRIQLSFLSPFAAVDFDRMRPLADRSVTPKAVSVIESFGYTVLSDEELRASARGIQVGSARVWDCLFAPFPEASS
ncbi:MAG: hypothetical protein AAFU79_02545 [Myxococcota bacterium]